MIQSSLSWRKHPPDLLTVATEWLLCFQNMPKAAPKDNSTHGIAVGTSQSCGAVARVLTIGVSSCQAGNAHFTYENALHPLFIGVRCTLTVKKRVNSRGLDVLRGASPQVPAVCPALKRECRVHFRRLLGTLLKSVPYTARECWEHFRIA